MARTYVQDLKELNITAAEYDNIISRIYDMTAEEMISLAKVIKSGAKVSPAVRMASERVLNMRQVERRKAGGRDEKTQRATKARRIHGSIHHIISQ